MIEKFSTESRMGELRVKIKEAISNDNFSALTTIMMFAPDIEKRETFGQQYISSTTRPSEEIAEAILDVKDSLEKASNDSSVKFIRTLAKTLLSKSDCSEEAKSKVREVAFPGEIFHPENSSAPVEPVSVESSQPGVQ